MPPGRRLGNTNTSKGRASGSSSSSSAVQQIHPAGESSSRSAATTSANGLSSSSLASRNGERERIEQQIEQLDQIALPLSKDAADEKLKSLRSEWLSMKNNFEIAFDVITLVGERMAEARAADGFQDEDEPMQELDIAIRGMIDLQESVNNRCSALEELRQAVRDDEQVTKANAIYKQRCQSLDDEYEKKTLRQRYAGSEPYKVFKKNIWTSLRDEEMPPIADLLPHGEGDEAEDEDDDVVAYGGDRQQFKCPISLRLMTEPLKSKVCGHAFEKESILSYVSNRRVPCPAGCSAMLSKKDLEEDAAFTRACRKFARREQMRKELHRSQAQATMLD